MKILVVHCAYKYKGGEDTVVEEEIKLLLSQGHEVELLLFNNSGNELLKVLQLPFNITSYKRTKEVLKRFRPDVVHIHNLHFAASPSVFYAIKSSNIPFVNTLHNYRLLCPSGTLFDNGQLFLDSLKQPFPWNAIRKGVYKNSKMLTLWLAISIKLHQSIGTWNLCNKYIVLTDYAKQLLLNSKFKLNKDQIVVKPNFSTTPASKNSLRNNYFLFVGRLTIEKGVRILLHTFSQLDYEIRIAGDGPLKDEVIDFSKRFPNIKFLGILEKQEVLNELQSCTALTFPSIWLEGMPLIIIEAFSSGTPVIGSKMGAMEDMITSGINGYHFKPGDQEDLKSKVIDWFQSSEHVKSGFRRNAQKTYYDYFLPKNNADQLLGIYKSVIKHSN